jgi:hypothetical protein
MPPAAKPSNSTLAKPIAIQDEREIVVGAEVSGM